MGHKVHPRAFRIGVLHGWKSKWFARKDYALLLEQDIKIRKFLLKKLREAGIGNITIERSASGITVNVFTSKPGIVIGRGGTGAEELKKELQKKFLDKKTKIALNIHEVTQPFLNSQLVAYSIIEQLEKRIPFRRAAKRSIEQVMQAGARGVKIIISGRLNGAEIARTEKFSEGSVPLHTLRADIDFGRGAAHTTYGMIGVKVWIYKGEVFEKDTNEENV
ncbi:MAG: 30S ribosomal protein S3 [Patescibacteria group bacterium]